MKKIRFCDSTYKSGILTIHPFPYSFFKKVTYVCIKEKGFHHNDDVKQGNYMN